MSGENKGTERVPHIASKRQRRAAKILREETIEKWRKGFLGEDYEPIIPIVAKELPASLPKVVYKTMLNPIVPMPLPPSFDENETNYTTVQVTLPGAEYSKNYPQVNGITRKRDRTRPADTKELFSGKKQIVDHTLAYDSKTTLECNRNTGKVNDEKIYKYMQKLFKLQNKIANKSTGDNDKIYNLNPVYKSIYKALLIIEFDRALSIMFVKLRDNEIVNVAQYDQIKIIEDKEDQYKITDEHKKKFTKTKKVLRKHTKTVKKSDMTREEATSFYIFNATNTWLDIKPEREMSNADIHDYIVSDTIYDEGYNNTNINEMKYLCEKIVIAYLNSFRIGNINLSSVYNFEKKKTKKESDLFNKAAIYTLISNVEMYRILYRELLINEVLTCMEQPVIANKLKGKESKQKIMKTIMTTAKKLSPNRVSTSPKSYQVLPTIDGNKLSEKTKKLSSNRISSSRKLSQVSPSIDGNTPPRKTKKLGKLRQSNVPSTILTTVFGFGNPKIMDNSNDSNTSGKS